MTAVLLDEMLSGTIAAHLRARGVDAAAVVDDPALIGTADEDLLAHATSHRRALVTANIGDFALIATDWRAAGRQHAGLVYVPSRAFPQDRSFVGAVVAALHALDSLALDGLALFGAELFLRRR